MDPTLPLHAVSAVTGISSTLNQHVNNSNDEAEETDKLEQKSKRTNIFTIVVMALIVVTFGFQGLAIGFNTDTTIIIVSGVFSCIVASTVAVKQNIMRSMDT